MLFLRARRAVRQRACGRLCFGLAGLALGSLRAAAVFAAEQTPPSASAALSPHAFSWGGSLQALGRYGRFNFLPRPGSLPRDALIMEAQMPLGPRKGLTVVRFMGKRLLLGVTEQNITLLASEDTVSHENESKSFRQALDDAAADAGPSGDHPAAS